MSYAHKRLAPTPYAKVNRTLSGAQVAQEVGFKKARERDTYECPSCDSSDALHCYPKASAGAFCFSCRMKFSAVDLAAAVWGMTPADACRRMADQFGIRADSAYSGFKSKPTTKSAASRTREAPDPQVMQTRAEVYGSIVANLRLGDDGRSYLAGRGLDSDFASVQGLRSIDSEPMWSDLRSYLVGAFTPDQLVIAGFAYQPDDDGGPRRWLPWYGSVPAILIPYYGRTGQIEAIRFRRMNDEKVKRYMAPLGAGARTPFGAERFDGPCPVGIVITEGEFDCLALIQAGWEAVALGGAAPSGAVFDFVVSAAEDVAELVLWTDADHAGDRAVDELIQRLANRYGANWVEGRVRRWRSKMDACAMARLGRSGDRAAGGGLLRAHPSGIGAARRAALRRSPRRPLSVPAARAASATSRLGRARVREVRHGVCRTKARTAPQSATGRAVQRASSPKTFTRRRAPPESPRSGYHTW